MDMVHRLVWFFLISCAVAYGVFLIVGSTIHARAEQMTRTVVARDVLQPEVHTLSGMVMVQSTCAQLSVQAEQMSRSLIHLAFTTWELPSIECERVEVPRPFRTVVFAPAVGVEFVATLDGEKLPLVVIPVVETQS